MIDKKCPYRKIITVTEYNNTTDQPAVYEETFADCLGEDCAGYHEERIPVRDLPELTRYIEIWCAPASNIIGKITPEEEDEEVIGGGEGMIDE